MCGMSQQPPVRSTGSPPPRPDASMSLLTNVMDHALDDGYAEASARRASEGGGLPRTLRAKLGLAAGLVLAALVVTLGAAQARISAPVVAKEREELIDRIEDETSAADGLEKRIEELRAEVGERQRKALEQHGGDQGQLVALLSGATPVHGPGVKLVVDDAEETEDGGGGPRESSGFADTGRVRDRDMQRVVNGLWQAGAEAVAINGQRLTALSAIRAAGDAILVDNKPLVPPYTVLAVGDGKKLRTTFQDSADGQYLHVLQENFGIRTSISDQGEVRLPAAPSLIVRTAQPSETGAGTGDGRGAAETGKGTS
ncbi:membrane protein [Streptomyces lavendofoliae]|uniref:Membrane protein n=2 Tax=Streptomyces lavendofoliae TaxID=67314 RepID=A0A918HYX0_9ACTN|nr:membrane protein [Streptomyces lavendofoliae]